MKARFLPIAAVMILFSVQPVPADESRTPEAVKMAKFQETPPLNLKKPDIAFEVKEDYKYYDIDGKSPDELRRNMRQNGTRWNDGKTYAAVTSWDIRYRYDTTSTNGLYGIKTVKTDVEIIYRLPRWEAARSSVEPLAGQWNSYMEKLMKHETGHRDLAVKAAADISEALASLSGFDSKRNLEKEADRIVQARLKLLKKVQVDYDVETHHGETQGAILQ